MVCKICSKEFPGDAEFHKHLRSHKITQCEYFQKFHPRFDLFDKSIIKFKNKDYYFNTSFNSRGNLKRWLSSASPEVGQKYVRDYLTIRKEKKGLVYAPSQIELRTMPLPGLKYIKEHFGDDKQFFLDIGLKPRFTQEFLDESLFTDISNKVIFTDSREQCPLEFDNTTRTKGMKYGDYRIAGSHIRIERKSVADMWGTLSGGFERFNREIIRAKKDGAYLVILVEGPFDELEKFPLQAQVRNKIKIGIEYINHNIRDLLQKHQNIQILFTKNREEASRIIQKIFSAGEQVKNVDLQYNMDINKL